MWKIHYDLQRNGIKNGSDKLIIFLDKDIKMLFEWKVYGIYPGCSGYVGGGVHYDLKLIGLAKAIFEKLATIICK